MKNKLKTIRRRFTERSLVQNDINTPTTEIWKEVDVNDNKDIEKEEKEEKEI